ncbi:MAG: PKD domain-containing protein [Saprospiraceae bacterium]
MSLRVVGDLETSCNVQHQRFFNPFANNPDANCYTACAYSEASFSLDSLMISDNWGSYFQWLQPSWTMTGGTVEVSSSHPWAWETRLTFDAPGEATLYYQIQVEDDYACQSIFTLAFCFDVLPPPEASFSTQPAINSAGILEVCEGQSVYFEAETLDAETYSWLFGDGTAASGITAQHTYTTAGVYELQFIAANGCECADTSYLQVVVVGNETPFVDCVATICEGTTTTYTANTGCSSYLWEISSNGTLVDGGTSTDDFITVEWGSGPVGEITLATDGCPDLSDCNAVAYIQVPIVSAAAAISGSESVCKGSIETYSLPPFEGTSFMWSVGGYGNIIAGQGTPSITVEWYDGPEMPPAQWVQVTYDNCYLGCGGNAQMEVLIRSGYYLSGEIEACEQGSTTFHVLNDQTHTPVPAFLAVLDDTGSIVWASGMTVTSALIDWDFGDGYFTVQATPQDVDGFCQEAISTRVYVYPQSPFASSIDGSTIICPGAAYTYSINNPQQGDRYQWTITNGATTDIRYGNSIAVSWEAAGPYLLEVVRLVAPLSCPSQAEVISVLPVPAFSISGDASVCTDQLAEYTSSQTGDLIYEWRILPATGGTIIGSPSDAFVQVLWHTEGPAQVQLSICGQVATLAVNVLMPPQPIVQYPVALCPGS